MSLRPAQALVAESSKFSLRTFFEGANGPAPSPMDAPHEGLPTLNAQMLSSQSMLQQQPLPMEPEYPSSPPSSALAQPHPFAGASLMRPTSAPAAPGQGKFTFNGMMPTTTPMQLQHKLLQQHQQAAIQTGTASASKTGAAASDPNEVLRLKAQVLSLTERMNQLNSNLASTSESVVRGNKALTTERAQFHAKFAGLSKKLEATQAALSEAEAVPLEAAKNAKLLNAKILELQNENHQLTQTRATLEATIETKASEVAALHEASQTAVETRAELQAQCDELTSKYTALAAQHSVVLSRQDELATELETHQAALIDAEARAEDAVAQLEAVRVEAATADNLVDELDAKLAEARMAAPTGACGCDDDPKNTTDEDRAEEEEATEEAGADEPKQPPTFKPTADAVEETLEKTFGEAVATTDAAPAMCCPKTMRCEALERAAMEAHGKMHCAEEADCERLAEEHRFADALAKRARWSLMNDVEERVVVAHLYTDSSCVEDALTDMPCCLSASIRDNPLAVAQPFDESFHLARVGTTTAAAAAAATADRTSTFVQAVSADLKFHMDDSQALYKSSSTTGTALKI